MGDINVDDFSCPNEACPDYGKKGEGNSRLKERYGKQNTALLRCKTGKKTFRDICKKKTTIGSPMTLAK